MFGEEDMFLIISLTFYTGIRYQITTTVHSRTKYKISQYGNTELYMFD